MGVIEHVEVTVRQQGHPDRVVRLRDGATRLGRSEDNDLVLPDVGISRRHARIMVASDKVMIEDLASGNGTYYRGRRVQQQAIEDGDELIIDPFVLQFRIRGAKRADDPTLDGPIGRLDVVAGPEMAQSSYVVPPRGLTIGRSETRDVIIPDPASSRHHSSVFLENGQYVLRDMGSANGVFINGYRVREAVLVDGDRVQIGNTELRFVLDDPRRIGQTPNQNRGGQSGRNGWSASGDVALPMPETYTPRASPRGRGTQSGQGSWLSFRNPIVTGALGGVTLLGFMALVMAVSGALLYVLFASTRAPESTTLPSGVPTWTLAGVETPAGADVSKLFDDGLSAMRERDYRRALQTFWLTLQADPNNPSAERFAYVAGEYVVVGSLETLLEGAETARLEREARRATLIADARRTGPDAEAAAATLVAEFRDDPVVLTELGWLPSEAERATQARLGDASDAVAREAWGDAVTIYAEVADRTADPAVRKLAVGGMRLGRRELARRTAPAWRAGVLAQAKGDQGAAAARFVEVKGVDPSNPSVRARLAESR